MELLRRTARAFREECRAFPQNAKLFSDEVLLELLTTDTAPRVQSLALAELAVRQMLAPRRYQNADVCNRFDVTQALCDRFGAGALGRFWDACERCAVSTDVVRAADRAFGYLQDGATGTNSQALSIFQDVFRPWLEADGVIPVFNAQGAYLLPFVFVERTSGEAARVIDWADAEIPEWTEHFRKFADGEGIVRDVKVAIQLNENVQGTGNSLMLPVLMAWWRKRDELPRYNVLRFIATGAYEGRRLCLVDTAEKEAEVERNVANGLLVRPGGGRKHGEISVGVGRDTLLARLRVLAEERYDCSPKYAYDRLNDLDRTVRELHYGDWKPLDDRLEHVFATVTEKDPEEYLWGLMLRSAAFCHAGQTDKAHELNTLAKEFASQLQGHQAQLLRLQVEELVILQDEEDFPKVYQLAPDLEQEIGNFSIQEENSDRAVDLQMRYWGTMGQFWLYDAVAHQDADLAQKARAALDRALKSARLLYTRSRQRNKGYADCSAYANCAQDTNYLLLWAAFFNHSGVQDAEHAARMEADSLRNDGADEKGADKNDAFRHRIVALANYMAVLAEEHEFAASDEASEIEHMAMSGPGWLAATSCKYFGAVASSRGEEQLARKWFHLACAKMDAMRKDGKYYGLVMQVIHMSVLAEAYRSLRRFEGLVAEAQHCREEALAMLRADGVENWHKADWKMWLETEGDDRSFPGKKYWY